MHTIMVTPDELCRLSRILDLDDSYVYRRGKLNLLFITMPESTYILTKLALSN